MLLRGSLTIARIAGIPIRVHWTFALLLAWIFATGAMQNRTLIDGASAAMFVIAIFVCVVLHELGHALAARRFGVGTRDITLLPIGGVAMLERMPEKPWQELVIAVAGPLVNVVIAAALFTGLMWKDGMDAFLRMDQPGHYTTNFVASLAAVNLWLVVFNMIPAFPMDGGRVLRAIMASFLGHERATQGAAIVGKIVAVLMAIAGLMISPMLILIALFVWIGAGGEAAAVRMRGVLRGLPVSAAMVRQYQVLGPDDTLHHAASESRSGMQHEFPVTAHGRPDEPVIGMLTHADLVVTLSRNGETALVRDVMRSPCTVVQETDALDRAVQVMREAQCQLVAVERDGRLVGVVTPQNIAELIAARGRRPKSGSTRGPFAKPV